jgi:hypothetical protein
MKIKLPNLLEFGQMIALFSRLLFNWRTMTPVMSSIRRIPKINKYLFVRWEFDGVWLQALGIIFRKPH